MDVVVSLLALIGGLGAGAGYLVDQTARQLLLDQLDRAEVLEVRVESTPNYRLIQGEADRIRVAGRGLHLDPYPRVEVLELETDPISIPPSNFQGGSLQLEQPIQAAVRVVITEADLNAALQAPQILGQFQDIQTDLPFASPQNAGAVVDLRDPAVELMGEDRIQLSARLVERTPDGREEQVDLVFSAGLAVENSQRLRLVEPEFIVDSVRVPREISGAFLGGLNEVLDLGELDEQGFVIRVLQFAVTPESLEVVGFVRVESLEGAPSESVSSLPGLGPVGLAPGLL